MISNKVIAYNITIIEELVRQRLESINFGDFIRFVIEFL